MILTFKHKGLCELFEKGATAKIAKTMHARCLVRLDAVDVASTPGDMDLPGFDFHALKEHKPTRYSVHVNGPWCVTFEFEDTDACRANFEQYH